jgi:hypothetical protein
MPSIKSDISNKTISNPNPLREFSVPDESGYAGKSFSGNADIDLEAMDALMRERGMPPVDRAMFNRPPVQQSLNEQERLMMEAKKVKALALAGQERLSAAALQRIKMLCDMSNSTRSVEIDGNKYVVRTLKGKEQRAAIMGAAEFDGTVQSPFEARKQFLAYALVEVAGADIELFLNDNSLEAKLAFIEELPEPVLVKLYDEYLILVRETQSRYFPKNEQEVKEVVEDLKK